MIAGLGVALRQVNQESLTWRCVWNGIFRLCLDFRLAVTET